VQKINYTLVDNFLKAKPKGTLKEFRKKHPKFKISSTMFYTHRRSRDLSLGNRDMVKKYKRNNGRKGIYMPIFSTPSENIPLVTKQILKQFIEALNNNKQTKMEVVEYSDPKKLEVREVQ